MPGGPGRAQGRGVRSRRRGFTLVELMGVVALLGILAAIAVNTFQGELVVAKRVEAVVGLSLLWKAQMSYYAANSRYASSFRDLDFGITGGRAVDATTYKGSRYTYQLAQPWGPTSFYAMATAQLDADPWPDILELYDVRTQ